MTEIIIDREFETLIPASSPEEHATLELLILSEGCRDSIIVWNGILIDGHNRYEICKKLGIPFTTINKEFEGRDEAKAWMMNTQLGRRNVSPYDRGRFAIALAEINIRIKAKEKQGTHTTQGYQKSDKAVNTNKELAKLAGVSHDTIFKVKIIEEKASDDTKQKLRNQTASIHEAYMEVKQKEKDEKREENRKQKTEAEPEAAESVIDANIDLRLGDFSVVLSDVEDGSLDLIITEPPNGLEYGECLSDLSEFASKKLKPSGFLIVFTDQWNLPSVMDGLSTEMAYYWMFCQYTKGKPQIESEINIMTSWRPILVYQKSLGILPKAIPDYFIIEQGQYLESGIEKLLEWFTKNGDLVCDPFAGEGAVPKICKYLNRNFIGSELIEETYLTAKNKI
jgi:hypothetical protein